MNWILFSQICILMILAALLISFIIDEAKKQDK